MESVKSSSEQGNRVAGRFAPGTSGNPGGRPKGRIGGRAAALATLDAIMADPKIQTRLGDEFKVLFDEDPIKFFKTILMPLMPQEMKAEIKSAGGVIEWVSLAERFPQAKKEAAS